MNLLEGQSEFTGKLGHEFNQLREAIRAVQPVDNPLMQTDRTTRGVSWQPTAELIARLSSDGAVSALQIATTDPDQVTAVTGEEILKPAGPKSESLTRLDPGDTANWHPRDGSQSSISYHFHTEHYRTAIIHASGNMWNGGAQAIDYHRQIQKLEPFYAIGDTIYAVKLGETWVDLNVAGRHWRNVYPLAAEEHLRVSTGGVTYFNPSYLFVTGTQQETDQLYSDDNPAWKSITNFSAFDIY